MQTRSFIVQSRDQNWSTTRIISRSGLRTFDPQRDVVGRSERAQRRKCENARVSFEQAQNLPELKSAALDQTKQKVLTKWHTHCQWSTRHHHRHLLKKPPRAPPSSSSSRVPTIQQHTFRFHHFPCGHDDKTRLYSPLSRSSCCDELHNGTSGSFPTCSYRRSGPHQKGLNLSDWSAVFTGNVWSAVTKDPSSVLKRWPTKDTAAKQPAACTPSINVGLCCHRSLCSRRSTSNSEATRSWKNV